MSSNIDDDLATLRAQRMAELQNQIEQQAAAQTEMEIQQQAAENQQAELDTAMKTILTPDARSRLASLNLVNPELTTQVKSHLSKLHSDNRIQIPVNDTQLKKILSGLSENKREVSIRRI